MFHLIQFAFVFKKIQTFFARYIVFIEFLKYPISYRVAVTIISLNLQFIRFASDCVKSSGWNHCEQKPRLVVYFYLLNAEGKSIFPKI